MQCPEIRLYRVDAVRELDRRAIAASGADGYALMDRAGAAAWRRLRARFPEAQRIVVWCGCGNNGGDGYVVARLARVAGLDVRVLTTGTPASTAAIRARAEFEAEGGVVAADVPAALVGAHLVVDALLGIGLSRAPEGVTAAAIAAIAQSQVPVLALDLPSGLDADTGHAFEPCIHAALTVCFLAWKRGLWTGAAADHVGECVLEALDVPASVVTSVPVDARLLDPAELRRALSPRAPAAHKGRYGHVLVVGGDHGMAGAARLAGEAAARSGAGLVSVATRPAHVAAIVNARPELMVHGIERALDPVLLARASVIALGPGLGQSDWSRGLWTQALASGKPIVLDADALNLLAIAPCALPTQAVLTPHPGEAARLLDTTVASIARDRYAAARELASRHQSVVVLKGAGTLIATPDGAIEVSAHANPGMASGGMGDVLTGIIAGLMAQHLDAAVAARVGVAVHAEAARRAAAQGARGLLAGEVLAALRHAVNP
jgi:NAD(P)H-hydrate epimerase